MIASPPATAPAKVACHRRVFFLMRIDWALALRWSRVSWWWVGTPVGVVMGTWTWMSSSPSTAVDELEGETKVGIALMRNLYTNVNVPLLDDQRGCGFSVMAHTKQSSKSSGVWTKYCMPHKYQFQVSRKECHYSQLTADQCNLLYLSARLMRMRARAKFMHTRILNANEAAPSNCFFKVSRWMSLDTYESHLEQRALNIFSLSVTRQPAPLYPSRQHIERPWIFANTAKFWRVTSALNTLSDHRLPRLQKVSAHTVACCGLLMDRYLSA